MNKMWDIYMIEYYTAIKRNQLLIHAVWMSIKIIILKRKKMKMAQQHTASRTEGRAHHQVGNAKDASQETSS